MNLFQIIIIVSLLGNTGLGVFVLLSNPNRSVNISFFALTCLMMLWLAAMFCVTVMPDDSLVVYWIQQTSAFAALIPVGVFILQLSIVNPEMKLTQILHRLRYWLLASLLAVIICHSPVFILQASRATASDLLPKIEYRWGFHIYIVFFIAVIAKLTVSFLKAAKYKNSEQKEELLFLQLGCVSSFIVGVFLVAAAGWFANQEIGLFVPLSVLFLDGFVAYGIATRRILAVSAVLQQAAAYALMAVYLSGLYALTVWMSHAVFRWFFSNPAYFAHLAAALAVAFSVAPVHGRMQTFCHLLFPNSTPVNIDAALKRAGNIFQEVSTEARLTQSFADLIAGTFGTVSLTVLRPDDQGSFYQSYPPAGAGIPPKGIGPKSPLIDLLKQDHEPCTSDMLQRIRPTRQVLDARKEMADLGATGIVGSFMRKEMKAVLLLSPKNSGRIYDLHDQKALQLLCDQFAVALENSNLYTAVQNGKIYNEILVDSLSSGIAAVNSDRIITVFNQRAREITGLPESAVINQPVSSLPQVLAREIEEVLISKGEFRDRDISFLRGDEQIPLRISGSLFKSHTGHLLGALLIFNDMTELKKMEEQIRRTDRLSSIGTLSAGMAHEIKNPLVTIKTFAQLLPEQYQNDDFRQTFFDLVGQEVKRIDSIVSRLLNFARPAKAVLKPVPLHEVIDNSLRLIEQQLIREKITLEQHLDAERHLIEADAGQLNQAFINFFLNSIESMKPGGCLTVRTSLVQHLHDTPQRSNRIVLSGEYIQMTIKDTGCGIPPEAVSRIFDPFFTRKEKGIGLGLSVSHGIIQEHKGLIDVESELNRGTVFYIQFPLHHESTGENRS